MRNKKINSKNVVINTISFVDGGVGTLSVTYPKKLVNNYNKKPNGLMQELTEKDSNNYKLVEVMQFIRKMNF